MITIAESKQIWNEILEKNRQKVEPAAPAQFQRLQHVSFRPGGNIKPNRPGRYALQHFPSLVQEYQRTLSRKQRGELFRDVEE